MTKNVTLIWKNVHGFASPAVAGKMDYAMLDWMLQLTECLEIWLSKNIKMSDGELILARANIGALVECWLKFFYCVYYDDYLKYPKFKKTKILEPNEMTIEPLKQFSLNILWEDTQDSTYIWVEKVQKQRNAIHAFNFKDIGTASEFIEDVDILFNFVKSILDRIPPLGDMLESYPAGYVINPYF